MERENIIRLAVGVLAFVFVLVAQHFGAPTLVIGIGACAALVFVAWDVFGEAFEEIREEHSLNEDALVSIAAIGALCLGQFAEALAVMTLFIVGEAIEDAAEDKSADSIKAMLAITSDTAWVVRGDTLTKTPAAQVAVGSIVAVRPGEKIPIDGVVVRGKSSLNCAALTGEARLVPAKVGDTVLSGSVNANDVLQIQTIATFENSAAAKLVKLAREAAEKKAATEEFITRFARVYTPAVCMLALAIALGAPLVALLFGYAPDLGTWVYRALSLLVVSCPCALVISIPLAYVATIGVASKNGLLIKGSCFVDALASVKIFACDKTGTLTEASNNTVQVLDSNCPGEVLRLAAYAESLSTHPVGLAIVRAFGEPFNPLLVSDIREEPGCGVQAMVEGARVVVGSRTYLEGMGIVICEHGECDDCVFVACDGKQIGALRLTETIKPGAKEALRQLANYGIRKFVLLSGDSEAAVSRVAREVGIDDYQAALLPEEKLSALESLMYTHAAGAETTGVQAAHKEAASAEAASVAAKAARRGCVAYVGDGINDAPVLARSDVGIAMGALGSDAAIEAADVVVMDDDLSKIPFAIRLARTCLKIVRTNIVFALAVKLVCLILVACGIAGMWVAICADMGVMILCVLNSFRILYVQRSASDGQN